MGSEEIVAKLDNTLACSTVEVDEELISALFGPADIDNDGISMPEILAKAPAESLPTYGPFMSYGELDEHWGYWGSGLESHRPRADAFTKLLLIGGTALALIGVMKKQLEG